MPSGRVMVSEVCDIRMPREERQEGAPKRENREGVEVVEGAGSRGTWCPTPPGPPSLCLWSEQRLEVGEEGRMASL